MKFVVAVLVLSLLAGCSIKRTAVNIIGDTISGRGDVYTSDNDPDLIREAMPFGLKTFESLLVVSPEHQGLLLSSARGFTAYAYLLQDEADRVDATDLSQARKLRTRAHNLYLRACDYALRGIEVDHPGFTSKLNNDKSTALAMTTVEDVPLLYWAGAAWAGALTANKENLDLIAELPTAGALVGRVLELGEKYDLGAAHEFFISYEGSRPGGSAEQARIHYRRALDISGGQRASVHLALAEAVAIREQKLTEFRFLLKAALKVDPDKVPEMRLANTVAQRLARWLETRIPDLFLQANGKEKEE
jgi:predicted anti-sigma-YlaC factor YlaD